RGEGRADIPVARTDRDLVAERLFDLVRGGRRHAAELDSGAVGADRVDPGRLLVGVDTDEPVEVREAGDEIIRVAHALDRLPGLVPGEFERARAHHVFL